MIYVEEAFRKLLLRSKKMNFNNDGASELRSLNLSVSINFRSGIIIFAKKSEYEHKKSPHFHP